MGAFVAKSDFGSIKIYSCNNINKNLWNTGVYTVFNSKFRIFVFVGTLSVYLRGYISSRADIDLCLCPSKVYASGNVEASLNLQVNGGASASLLVRHNPVKCSFKILQEKVLFSCILDLAGFCRNLAGILCKIPARFRRILQDLAGMQEKGPFLVRSCKSVYWVINVLN